MRQSGVRDLLVWQKAMDLVVGTYSVTAGFPADERFGLTTQLRRAAVSVPSNIAEGRGRATPGEYANHLSIARGSLNEVDTLIEIALRLNLIDAETSGGLLAACDEISRMLTGLKRSICR